ncbi:MAG: hypothetical protein AAF721_03340 [Myxococcota bacterium]
MRCWGLEQHVGVGGRALRVPDVGPAVQVASGFYLACALQADGKVSCWDAHHRPATVDLPDAAVKIDVGQEKNCAVLQDGHVACWNGSESPSLVTGLSDVTDLSVGFYHACAVTSGSSLSCWGSGAHLQLGVLPLRVSANVPVAVASEATGISSRGYFSCATFEDGPPACWGVGHGFDSFLASGSFLVSETPIPYPELAEVTALSVGWRTVCGVRVDGTVVCAGGNAKGEQGVTPDAGDAFVSHVVPVRDAITVDTGSSYACALTGEDHVYCWGADYKGRLGIGTTTEGVVGPTRVAGLDDDTPMSWNKPRKGVAGYPDAPTPDTAQPHTMQYGSLILVKNGLVELAPILRGPCGEAWQLQMCVLERRAADTFDVDIAAAYDLYVDLLAQPYAERTKACESMVAGLADQASAVDCRAVVRRRGRWSIEAL